MKNNIKKPTDRWHTKKSIYKLTRKRQKFQQKTMGIINK